MAQKSYKQCGNCGEKWASREQFLSDPALVLIGYQVNFKQLATGIIMFNHACKTTLALYASEFEDLYDGPVFRQRATGSTQCPGYCLHRKELRPCPAECECAYLREVLQRINHWPKRSASATS